VICRPPPPRPAAGLQADQHRDDDAGVARVHGAAQAERVAGVDDGHAHRLQVAHMGDEAVDAAQLLAVGGRRVGGGDHVLCLPFPCWPHASGAARPVGSRVWAALAAGLRCLLEQLPHGMPARGLFALQRIARL
jgi:hypothetical protein